MNLAIVLAEHRYARIEAAGIFWIAAELGILVLVRAGRRHLETRPLPAHFGLTRRDLRYLLPSGGMLLGLLILYLFRHAGGPPVMDASNDILAAIAAREERVHLALWSGFVLIWIILEALIVYHGWRGYRQLRLLLKPGSTA